MAMIHGEELNNGLCSGCHVLFDSAACRTAERASLRAHLAAAEKERDEARKRVEEMEKVVKAAEAYVSACVCAAVMDDDEAGFHEANAALQRAVNEMHDSALDPAGKGET